MASITIGDEMFPSKQALKEYLSNVLAETPAGSPVPSSAGRVLRELVEFHPGAAEKIGAGITSITVEFHDVGPAVGRSFYLTRPDGTKVDFSFHKCLSELSGRGFREREVKNKLRFMVNGDVEAFRATLPDVTECALTGVSLRRDTAHIDHAYPWTFQRLVERFMVRERLTWSTFPIGYSGDPFRGRIVTVRGVADRWYRWHADRSHLRPIDPRINSRLGANDPASIPFVREPFNAWVDENRKAARARSSDDRTRQRAYMLPRIREVFWAHPRFLRVIEHQHELLAQQDTASAEEAWFDRLIAHGGREEAA